MALNRGFSGANPAASAPGQLALWTSKTSPRLHDQYFGAGETYW